MPGHTCHIIPAVPHEGMGVLPHISDSQDTTNSSTPIPEVSIGLIWAELVTQSFDMTYLGNPFRI